MAADEVDLELDEAAAVAAAAAFLRGRLPEIPRALLVLGSGLGDIAARVPDPVRIGYEAIPGFARSTVQGHSGAVVAGTLNGIPVAIMQGRFHLYEGVEPAAVVRPVRAFAALGVPDLLITNAAGGTRAGMRPGDLMLISDHINLLGLNPLTGAVLGQEPRFPDMSEPYDATLRQQARAAALRLGVKLHEGVYAAVLGPSYETPAEVKMLIRFGADAIGMSTVPEVIAARAAGMRVIGFSCVTNLAAGLTGEPLSHEEVMRAAASAKDKMGALLDALLPLLASTSSRAAP